MTQVIENESTASVESSVSLEDLTLDVDDWYGDTSIAETELSPLGTE